MLAEEDEINQEKKYIFVAIEQPKNGRILKRHYPLDRNTKKKETSSWLSSGQKLEQVRGDHQPRRIQNNCEQKKQTFCLCF